VTTSPQPEPIAIERMVGSRLGEHDVRFTAARRLVVRTLSEAAGPQAAAELHERLRDEVPLSSLYRTLSVLEESGVLHRQHGPDGIARYELAEWLRGHHHHLVCTRCGAVADVDIDLDLERRVGEIITDLAGDHGWTTTGHRIDIEGLCPACRTT
jgi:Fur family ferric uptake transcriptional regulator